MTAQDGVRIVEVGPRDGLQNIAASIPTPTKIELITRLLDAGLCTVELTSNVAPAAVPQLSDGLTLLNHEKIQRLLPRSDRRLPVLVPNVKRLQALIKAGVREVAVFISATEGFSRANIRCSVEEGLARAKETIAAALKAGLVVRGYVSCIFADPFDGPTSPDAVLRCTKVLLEAGCYEVSLGDTLGVGTASDVSKLLEYLTGHGIAVSQLAGHFHDTYGQAVSNVWAAYKCGMRVFDSSVGGLGGCPFAPGAKGNVSTEDVVYLFHQAGIPTGVDLERVAAIGAWICQRIPVQNCSRAGPALLSRKARAKQPARGPPKKASRLEWELQTSLGGDEVRIYTSATQVRLVLNRPKNGNALTETMIEAISDFFVRAKSDPSITHIVLEGTGRFFCTGMDLSKSGTSVGAQTSTQRDAQFNRLTRLLDLIDTAPQVTIAAINGSCFGGGVGIAFACDIRLADAKVSFTMSEARLGLCPATISKYVIREWGPAFAREAMLSTRPVTARQLHRLGLIAELSDETKTLPSVLDEYLTKLRKCAPGASTMCKELVRLAWTDPGGTQQQAGIKALFDEMMRPDAEGAHGVSQFQKGVKDIDWAKRSKL